MALPFSPLISRQTSPPPSKSRCPPSSSTPFQFFFHHTQSFGFHSPKRTTFPFCYIFLISDLSSSSLICGYVHFSFSFSLSPAAAVFFSGENGAWGKRWDFSSCYVCTSFFPTSFCFSSTPLPSFQFGRPPRGRFPASYTAADGGWPPYLIFLNFVSFLPLVKLSFRVKLTLLVRFWPWTSIWSFKCEFMLCIHEKLNILRSV